MDGVLCDFCTPYAAKFVRMGHRIPTEADDFPAVWSWPEHYGVPPNESKSVWHQTTRDSEFWLNLAPFRDNVAVAKEWCKRHDVYFITTRPFAFARDWSYAWLRKHGFDAPMVLVSEHKGLIAKGLGLDFHVDDSGDNIDAVAGVGVTGYIIDAPYNRQCVSGVRVRSMLDIAA